MKSNYTFTSESVCSGHPDKVCDRLSDSIVDAVLEEDPNGHVAIESLVTINRAVIAGEVKAKAKINYEAVIREQIRKLGYTKKEFNFFDKSPIDILVHTQSSEIATGVNHKGAGDQGMMFGFACKETPSLMPLPITLAHRLAQRIDQVRELKILPYLYPDGKTQVTIEYKNGKPVGVQTLVIAVPHQETVSLKKVSADLYREVVNVILDDFGFAIKQNQVVVNGTGVWHHGGPAADTGVTGRKIIVDTYGGYARVGGGCFSGKDPTKVDRSGAYAARFLAKNIVAHNLADRAEVRLAYFIGARKPIMQEVETFGTSKVSASAMKAFMAKILDTSVAGILDQLDLRHPIYTQTSAYGHFGRDSFPWEKIVE